jgi:hypothetical protein
MNGWLIRLISFAAALLLANGCGSTGNRESAAGETAARSPATTRASATSKPATPTGGERLEYDGVTITLPTGWEGRVISPAVIQAANFKFAPVGIELPPGEEDPIKAMTARHALVSMLRCGLVSYEPTARAAPEQISLDELTFLPSKHPGVPWRHAYAQASFYFGRRCLHISVDFGRAPPRTRLVSIVNEMLGSLSVAQK